MDAINLEVKLFLSSVLWGIGLVILYDCIRIFRRVIKHNKFWAGFEDLLYWAVSAVLIFQMMYRINDGTIRGFAIVGVIIGMTLYHYSISEWLVYTTAKGVHKSILGTRKTMYFIMRPVVWIGRRLCWMLGFFTKFLARPLSFFRKSLQKIWKQVKIAVVKK
ncbi:spore cortex biosynthesis protein YabQ [[Clostridium] polysaccharolyticum]|jgi:spore cortex biosynthesis protein YabQ|uniref:Spore cortex biosynthesis protein YabQ n=1 Tax=[Clostridium] polysaccharolyticum TaxID=29364 RepID=A0A1I0E9E2_9FIRM|nr:spore cortex biosynthesis protein YabQ [[Clostridium] polysaccharolyticum]SET41639.1 spore cortex biosynthesis protein YabQ [[Clostridium] polysaccharolyticum]